MTTLTSNPLDVARTRIMNEHALEIDPEGLVTKRLSLKYSTNPFKTMLQITTEEGVMALYKGFVPSYVRLGSVTVGFFVVYEQLRHTFGISGL